VIQAHARLAVAVQNEDLSPDNLKPPDGSVVLDADIPCPVNGSLGIGFYLRDPPFPADSDHLASIECTENGSIERAFVFLLELRAPYVLAVERNVFLQAVVDLLRRQRPGVVDIRYLSEPPRMVLGHLVHAIGMVPAARRGDE